jgi:hypothetical protein
MRLKKKQPPKTTDTKVIISNISNRISRKRLALIIVAILVVSAAGWWVYGEFYRQGAGDKVVVCTDVLKEAAGVLAPEKTAKLKPIAEKIQTLPRYDEDPNCLNVVATYYINASDAKNARQMLNKLEAVYKPADGFAKELGSGVGKTIEELRDSVSFVEKLEQEFKNNTFHGPEV